MSHALAPRIGRPSVDEIETRTPTGRALHWLEARLLDLAHTVGLFEAIHEREVLLDATCDDLRERAIALLNCPCSLEARVLLLEQRDRDALRDAADRQGARHISITLRRVVQRIGGFIERSCVALRGGRP